MSVVEDAEKQVQSMRDELQGLSDRIKLKLHLGEMELKKRYEQLEPSLKDFERKAEHMKSEVGGELKEAWSHLTNALSTIEKELHRKEGGTKEK
jgi:predicted  nucleic acid-binding Zn-ribbon protein